MRCALPEGNRIWIEVYRHCGILFLQGGTERERERESEQSIINQLSSVNQLVRANVVDESRSERDLTKGGYQFEDFNPRDIEDRRKLA